MIQLRQSFFQNVGKEETGKLIELAEPYFVARKRKHHRCWRKLDINEQMQAIKSGNTMVPFEYYIVNMAKGYLAGKPPVYTFTKGQDAFEQAVTNIKRHNDDATMFAKMIQDFIITSAAYMYVIENENNQIEYKRIDPLNSVVVYNYDIEPKPIAVVRILEIEEETRIEVVTAERRVMRDKEGKSVKFIDFTADGKEQEVYEKELFWADVSVVAFEHPQAIAIFEPAENLIDMFENMLTNKRSMTQYNDEAKLVIKGHQTINPPEIMDENDNVRINPKWQEEISRLYQAQALHFPTEGGAEWLIKNVDYAGMISTLADIKDLIFTVTSVPNMADRNFANNVSGIAMKYKMFALDQYVTELDRIFKKGYRRLWNIVTNRLNQRGSAFDILDLEVGFAKNAPQSSAESSSEAVNLFRNGVISQYSAIVHAEVGLDPAEEMERISAEAGTLQDETSS